MVSAFIITIITARKNLKDKREEVSLIRLGKQGLQSSVVEQESLMTTEGVSRRRRSRKAEMHGKGTTAD